MNAIGRAITFTFPVLTKRGTIVGMISVSNRWQSGHWRSMYSIIVTGALGLPSTFPCCGMPLNILTAEPDAGSGAPWFAAHVPVLRDALEHPHRGARVGQRAGARRR